MRLIALALIVVLLAPVASAQLPPAPTPTYRVTIQNAPAAFGAIASNTTGSVAFQVVLAIENVVCTAAVTVPVTITATPANAPTFLTVAPEPMVVNITIGQGPHPAGSPGGGTGDVALVATVGNITANASVPITVIAEAAAPAGAPQGCQGAGAPVGAAASEPVTIFANLTAPPPAAVIEAPPEEKGFLPGPGAFLGILAAVGAAIAMRRRS